METEDKVMPDTEVQDVDTGVDNEENDSSDSDDFHEKYENQKKRAENAEKRLKALKEAMEEQPEKEEKSSENLNSTNDTARLDRIEMRQMGYADEVINQIQELGGLEALKNPILKASADKLQADHAAANAADIKDGPNATPETKYSKEDLDEMSVEELEKVLPHAE